MTVTEPAAAGEDRYPTRVNGETHLLERTEPTVWPSAVPGPMDEAELAAHDGRGYSMLEGLLSPAEVQAYWAELHRLCTDSRLRADERVVLDGESGEIRSIFAVQELSALIGELVTDPRVLGRARQILGSEVYLHQSRVNLLPGFTEGGFFWRSDFEEWHAVDGMPEPRALGMSISLTDNYPACGGLMVIPGSHRTYVSCAGGRGPSQADITKLAAEGGIDHFGGQAGGAALLDSNLLYGASNNITPYPRSNIFLAFNSVHNPLGPPFSAAAPRPSHLAARDATPVSR